MRYLFLLAVLVGCASAPPARSDLHRGTLTRPPPAETRPGVGLPRYDPHVEPLPPQPQPQPQRLLPQTPETARQPGIWASGSPEWWTTREPVLLGERLPYPAVAHERDTWATRMCAARADAIREQIMRPNEEQALADKACLAARLYLLCATKMEANVARDLARGEMKDAALQNHLADVTAAANRMKAKACAKISDEGAIKTWMERFEKLWERTQV